MARYVNADWDACLDWVRNYIERVESDKAEFEKVIETLEVENKELRDEVKELKLNKA